MGASMKIPKTVVIIGAVHQIEYRKIPYVAGSMPNMRSFKDFLLATNSTGTELYIIPNITTGEKKLIRDKSGKQSGIIHTSMKYKIPALTMKKIGICESIQYSSDWWEGHLEKYEHIFAEHPALYADQNSRFSIAAIKAKRGKIINESGIIS